MTRNTALPTRPGWIGVRLHRHFAAAVVAASAACSDQQPPTSPIGLASSAAAELRAAENSTGAVYIMTNGASGNAVLSFRRAANGSLTPLGATFTGGTGTGGTIDPLMSQYSVLLTSNHAFLFVVNAGSDDISSFIVAGDGTIGLAGRVPSGGDQPVSLAAHGTILYALNKGNNTVSGFRITSDGTLKPIERSTRSLRSGAAGASTVAFTPDGRWLIVTEIMSNRLETFPVNTDGRLGDPRITMSSGAGPFGFAITARNQPIVTEVMGAAPNGAVSSYRVAANGALGVVTASLSAQQMATCWLVLTAEGRYAFASNSASGSIAAFGVAQNAALTLLDPRAGVSGPAGTMPSAAVPIDLALSTGDRYLYVLEAGTGTIGTFAVGAGGTLSARADTPAGSPASGLQGLAAW